MGMVLGNVAIVVALALITLTAVLGHPVGAVYLLAIFCAGAAGVRAYYREPSLWFAAKDWRVDCAFFLVLALGLAVLDPMARVAVDAPGL